MMVTYDITAMMQTHLHGCPVDSMHVLRWKAYCQPSHPRMSATDEAVIFFGDNWSQEGVPYQPSILDVG